MGNLNTSLTTDESKYLFSLGISDTDLNNNINIIKKIIRNIINSYAKKTILKYDYDSKKYVLDIKKLHEYFNSNYYIPIDDNGKTIVLDKRDYTLLLFRTVEQFLPSFNINNALYNSLLQNIKINNSLSEHIDPSDCNIDIRVTLNKNTVGEYHEIIISLPENDSDKILNNFEKYLKNNHDNILVNRYMGLLNKMKKKAFSVENYFSLRYYLNIDTNDKSTCYVFISLLTFLILSCKTNYIFSNLGLELNDTIKKTRGLHRNKLFFQKEYDTNNNIIKINAFHYEPHGTTSGFSLNQMKIEKVYNRLNDIINKLKQDNIYKNIYNINFNINKTSCPIGVQTITAKEDVGYCSIFSTFWFNIFINTLINISAYDNFIKYKKNLNNNIKLSNIPISDWIHLIDSEIIEFKKYYDVSYDDNKYDLEYILTLKKYMFIEDYSKHKYYFMDYYQINNEQTFYETIKNKMLSKYKNNKITIETFLNYYENILNEYGSKSNEIKDIIKNMHKLKTAEYFNIFVIYAHNLFEIAYKNDYFSQDELKQLNNFLNDPKLIEYIKDFIFPHKIKTISNINLTNIQEEYEYKKEYEQRKKYIEKSNNRNNKINIKEYNIPQIIGNKEFENMMNEQEDERNKILKNNCYTDQTCKNINKNLYCDYKTKLCTHNKMSIGEDCIEDKDCLSEYCKETKNSKLGITVKYCRNK